MKSRRTPNPMIAILAGAAVLTLSSYVTVPMVPVPMTLQTLAVLVIGVVWGWRLGAVVTCIWLALGAIGLPVLAGGTGGIDRFTGPTAGFLFAFPVAAALAGVMTRRRPLRWTRTGAAMVAGHAVCLAMGAAWLARSIGPNAAIASGIMPFIAGAAVKSALGVGIIALAARSEGKFR